MPATRSAEPIYIFTDGCALGNPGPGGYGVIFRDGGKETEVKRGFRHTTNNRMEIMAVLHGLRDTAAASAGRPTIVESDSRYVVDAIDKDWLGMWKQKQWKRTKYKVPVKNVDLWEEMLALIDGREIEMKWVKGHAGNCENERCDKLANAAARLPESSREVDHHYVNGSASEPDAAKLL